MEKSTARLEAFSDGIFGVAITLLAIEIGIKEYEHADNMNLWHKIIEKWPEYFTYFNSFATVLLIWMGHNQIIDKIRKPNHWIILLNGFLLLFVVLFPYPTRMVGAFIGTEAVNTAVSFYAAYTGIIVLCMFFLNLGILKNSQYIINPSENIPWFKNMMKGQIVGITAYLVAAILALQFPAISLFITFGMWVFWAIMTRDKEEV